MKYNAPLDNNGKPYYIPVVAKNRDYLVGYLDGLDITKKMITEIMEQLNIEIDMGPIDVILDSTRFNDVLDNGKRESETTDDELKDYINEMVEDITVRMSSKNQENNIESKNILDLECSCGYGFYSWDSNVGIPHDSVQCANCGKYLIHYTNNDDYVYEYDGGK